MSTLKDIANACQLDISTISRALRDDARVKQSTKNLVLKTARELNYQPNWAARSLAQGQSRAICLITNGLNGSLERNIAQLANEYALKKNYDLLIQLESQDPKSLARQINRFNRGFTDGLLIIPGSSPEKSKIYQDIYKQNTPIVSIDRYDPKLPIPAVTSDNHNGAFQLVEKCIEYGSKKFYILFNQKNIIEKNRLNGAVSKLKEAGFNYELITDLSHKVNKKHNDPVAIIGTSQNNIKEFFLNNKSKLINEKIVAACFDYWEGEPYPFKKVFIAIQNFDEMTKKAVELVSHMIENKTKPGNQITNIPIKNINTLENLFAI